jgi:hypothetical protein
MKPTLYPTFKKTRQTSWEPSVVSRNEKTYLKIAPGTINNLLPTNWQTEFSLSNESINYIKLRFTASAGGQGFNVTGCQLVVDTVPARVTAPKRDSPPVTGELLIGVYFRGEYDMIFDSPIFIYPIVFYTSARSNPRPGEESFDKYFIWHHAQ